jgi:hypothetical protein
MQCWRGETVAANLSQSDSGCVQCHIGPGSDFLDNYQTGERTRQMKTDALFPPRTASLRQWKMSVEQRETGRSLSAHEPVYRLVCLDSSVYWQWHSYLSTAAHAQWATIIQTNVTYWLTSFVPRYIQMFPIISFFSLFGTSFSLFGKFSN